MSPHGGTYRAGLERFGRGEADRDEAREVVRHLLAGCSQCLEATSSIWPAAEGPDESERPRPRSGSRPDRHDYSAIFARVEAEVGRQQLSFAEERAAVPELRRELGRHPRARQEVLASNSSRFHTWPLVEALLDDCRRLCQADWDESAHLARLAVRLADMIDADRYGRERVADLRARSWAELGNVLRVQERFPEAERAFAQARELLRAGTGDPVEKAALLSLEASMRSGARQFDRALELLDRVIAIARRFGESELWARALVQKAIYNIDRGFPEAGLSLLLEAQKYVDPAVDPRLAGSVQHNVLYALVQAGRFEEAAAGLADTRALYRRLDVPLDRVRIDWLEARVLHGLGRLEEAESRYRLSLEILLAEGLDLDAGMVGLDLAALYSEQGRNAEMRELAAAMLPVFCSRRIHREAIAALLVFREAVAMERVSTKLVRDLSVYLRRSTVDPSLRFQPPPGLHSGG